MGCANPTRRNGSARVRRGGPIRDRRQDGAEDPLLPQSDGTARHLAGPEKRSHGNGLHRRLRWRGARHGKQPDQDQRRQSPEARRTERTRGDALAGQGYQGRWPHRGRRAARLCHRAQVRGLGGAAVRQRHRPAGQQGPAAVRGVQPGTGVRTARVRDRRRGGQGAQGCRRRPAGRHEAPRRFEPGPAQELGHLRGTGARIGPIRGRPANAHVPLAGVRHRHGKEGRPGHALHAWR